MGVCEELHCRALCLLNSCRGPFLTLSCSILYNTVWIEKNCSVEGEDAVLYYHPSVGVYRARQLNAELCVHPGSSDIMGLCYLLRMCVFTWFLNGLRENCYFVCFWF